MLAALQNGANEVSRHKLMWKSREEELKGEMRKDRGALEELNRQQVMTLNAKVSEYQRVLKEQEEREYWWQTEKEVWDQERAQLKVIVDILERAERGEDDSHVKEKNEMERKWSRERSELEDKMLSLVEAMSGMERKAELEMEMSVKAREDLETQLLKVRDALDKSSREKMEWSKRQERLHFEAEERAVREEEEREALAKEQEKAWDEERRELNARINELERSTRDDTAAKEKAQMERKWSRERSGLENTIHSMKDAMAELESDASSNTKRAENKRDEITQRLREANFTLAGSQSEVASLRLKLVREQEERERREKQMIIEAEERAKNAKAEREAWWSAISGMPKSQGGQYNVMTL